MRNEYSIMDKIYLMFCLLFSKFINVKVRLIRLPVDIRGKKYIDWGKNLTTGRYCRFEAFSQSGEVVLSFGNNVQINDFVHITAMGGVKIGNDVLIAGKVYISDCTHGSYKGDIYDSFPMQIPKERAYSVKNVIIEDCVWVGESVSILPGSIIGKGSIIGANSIVNSVLPPYSIAVGIPAKVIKRYCFETGTWRKVSSQGAFID